MVFAVVVAALVMSGCSSAPSAPLTAKPSPVADYAELMTRCLGEAGFEAEANGGGLIIESTSEQSAAVDAATTACHQKFGYDDTALFTDEQLGAMYIYEIETAACLEKLGYTIELPSKQSYIDNYYNPDEPAELPHGQVMEQGATGELLQSTFAECPPAGSVYDPNYP